MVTERTKKTGVGSAKAAGVAAGKGANQAGNTPPLARQTVDKRNDSHLYIWGLVWLWLVTPFLLLCLIAPEWAGALGKGISSLLNQGIGMAGWMVPMITFLAASWCFNYNNRAGRINIKVVIPLLLLFSVFFAARCSQGGNIGQFIDGLVVSIVGQFGAWTLATLGFLSVFVFTWNLTTEETIEGCKALSHFSGSSLSELGHRTLGGLSKLWGWIISARKSFSELLSNAKDRLSEPQEDDDDIESEAKAIENTEPTDLEQKAIFYEESGLMPTPAYEAKKIESLTSRGFFADDNDKERLERDSFEESLQAPRCAEPKPAALERERLDKAERNELIEEIHRRNTSGEMASVRNKEYEAARKAELAAEAKRPSPSPTLPTRAPEQMGRPDDKTAIRGQVYGKHEPTSAKEGLALSRRLAERPAHNSGSSFTRSSASFSSRPRLGEKNVNEEKDLPLRPVRSSSSGGYKAAHPVGASLASATTPERRPNLIDSDETVEIASLKRASDSKPVADFDKDSQRPFDELDKKVEALKFAESLDSDLNLATSNAGGARTIQAQPQAEVGGQASSEAAAEANSEAASAQKMSDLSPEERRRALGIIRRPAGRARTNQVQIQAEARSQAPSGAAATEANLDAASSKKMSDLSPEERRRALGIIRRPAGRARTSQAQIQAEAEGQAPSGTDANEANWGSEEENISAASLKKLNALSPEERRRALGIRGAAAPEAKGERNSLSDIKALSEAEGNRVACDPKAALQALSSRRPGLTSKASRPGGPITRAGASVAEPKTQASFTRSSTPSLMRSTASRSTAVSRTVPAKQPPAEAQEMSKEARLAAWRASTLRARASFKRQSEGKARLRQEKAVKEAADDMPFANDLMNPQGPTLRPPLAQSHTSSAAAALASKPTARRQLGIIPRARRSSSTSGHAASQAARQTDSSDADDVDFRKKNSEIASPCSVEPSKAHSAIGSPEMLSRLASNSPLQMGIHPQLGELSDASLNRQVKARLSQFHSAVGELQGVTWSEGGDLDSLLTPSQHSAAALVAVDKSQSAEEMPAEEPFVPEVAAPVAAPTLAISEATAPVEVAAASGADSNVDPAAELVPSVPTAASKPTSALAQAEKEQIEEEEDRPFPKPRSSANHKAVSSPEHVVVAQPASRPSGLVVDADIVSKATNSVSRAEVASYLSSDCIEDDTAAPTNLLKAKSTAEVEVPSELLEATSVADKDEQSVKLQAPVPQVEANQALEKTTESGRASQLELSEPISAAGAAPSSSTSKPSTVKRFDLGLGNEGAALDFNNIMPRDRDRFTNLRPINLTGSSVYRNPIRPSFFVASRTAAKPTGQPAPATPAAPAVSAAVVQLAPAAPAAPAVSAAVAQPAPAAPAAPAVSAAVAQPASAAPPRRSPAFGFDKSERRIIGNSTPVSGSALTTQRPAALYPSSIPTLGSVRVAGQQPSNLASASLAMPRKSNSGSLAAVEHYMLPSLSLLEEVPSQSRHEFVDKSELLIRTLTSFKVEAKVRNVIQGPAVTRYELEPAIGVRVNKFINLTNDIALALAATTVRIEAPVPGKSVVGVEVPNGFTELVSLKEVLSSDNFRNGKGLCVGLGKDISGTARVTDLSKMPHLLVAGTTGSGKSVCINTLILSLLYRFTPRNLQLLMIDPKQVELSIYEGLPHLICLTGEEPGKIIVDPKMASSALHQMVNLMEERYTMFSKNRVRNIGEYNMKHPEATLPWVVIIIDELADLMMVASKDVEKSICRLAQKARAAGIHMVVATQRPSTDVITGLLKVNIPSRIAFAVSSGVDSRVILDDGGAEHLLGKGDMLFKPVDANNGARIQGAFVKNDEIQRVVDFWNRQDVPSNRIQLNIQEDMAEDKADKGGGTDANDDDPLLEEALDAILRTRQASASMLQTELRVGYARARRLINLLEKRGYVGPAEGSKARKILYTGAMD